MLECCVHVRMVINTSYHWRRIQMQLQKSRFWQNLKVQSLTRYTTGFKEFIWLENVFHDRVVFYFLCTYRSMRWLYLTSIDACTYISIVQKLAWGSGYMYKTICSSASIDRRHMSFNWQAFLVSIHPCTVANACTMEVTTVLLSTVVGPWWCYSLCTWGLPPTWALGSCRRLRQAWEPASLGVCGAATPVQTVEEDWSLQQGEGFTNLNHRVGVRSY